MFVYCLCCKGFIKLIRVSGANENNPKHQEIEYKTDLMSD